LSEETNPLSGGLGIEILGQQDQERIHYDLEMLSERLILLRESIKMYTHPFCELIIAKYPAFF
jgi:hypothetical protein